MDGETNSLVGIQQHFRQLFMLQHLLEDHPRVECDFLVFVPSQRCKDDLVLR